MTLFSLKTKNLSVFLIGALMILVPIQYCSEPSFGISALRLSQQQIYQVASIGLFAIFILQNVFLAAFLLWALFLYAYFDFASPAGGVVLTILAGCLIYEAVYRIVNDQNVKIIFGFMISFALLNMAYMAFQSFGWELLYKEYGVAGYQAQLLGFMGLKAIMGMFFAMAIPFFAYRYPVLSLGLFMPIYVSECSSAMVAAIAAYLFQIFFWSKKMFFFLLVLMCIGGGLYAVNDSHAGMFTDRANMWKTVLRDAVKKPIIGWGPDSFRCVTPDKQFMYWKNVRTKETAQIDVRDTIEFTHTGKYDTKKYGTFIKDGDTTDPWDNPHNEYIQLFYEFGLPGVLILFLLAWDMTKRFNWLNWDIVPIAGFFIALLIMSTGQFPFHLARVGIYIPIFLACYYKLSDTYV